MIPPASNPMEDDEDREDVTVGIGKCPECGSVTLSIGLTNGETLVHIHLDTDEALEVAASRVEHAGKGQMQ